MKFNDAGSALYKENEDIVIWLRDYTNLDSEELTNLDIKAYQDVSTVDKINQELRELLNREFMALEDSGDKVGIRSGLVLMRTMHQRRKVSDLIGLLQVPED